VLHSEQFGLQRKIVANMTTESWDNTPHVTGLYEPDVTDFLAEYRKLRELPEWKDISLNTVMLYVITQGLIACPALNAHIDFRRPLVYGKIEQYADVNISMPMGLPNGTMMTINIHNCERKTLREMQDYVNDVRRRMANTSLDDALFEVAFADTMQKLKQLRVLKVIGRLLGTKIAAGPIHRLKGAKKKAYKALPGTERLTKEDIEQGTIVVSNVGSIYRGGNYLSPLLLEIIPPHVAALVVSAVVEKPGVVTAPDDTKIVEPRQYIPLCLAFDHRAVDFGDVVPFINRLDDVFASPAQIKGWL
jgi:pyruvate dehydrogenase E2 component (dihydrolipoamide acetyltransferase)